MSKTSNASLDEDISEREKRKTFVSYFETQSLPKYFNMQPKHPEK